MSISDKENIFFNDEDLERLKFLVLKAYTVYRKQKELTPFNFIIPKSKNNPKFVQFEKDIDNVIGKNRIKYTAIHKLFTVNIKDRPDNKVPFQRRTVLAFEEFIKSLINNISSLEEEFSLEYKNRKANIVNGDYHKKEAGDFFINTKIPVYQANEFQEFQHYALCYSYEAKSDFETADKCYKNLLIRNPNETILELIARYFWFTRANFILSKNIYSSLKNSTSLNTRISIRIFNSYAKPNNRVEIQNDIFHYNTENITDDWLYLKYFFITFFNERTILTYSTLYLHEKQDLRTFKDNSKLLEYYLYLYALLGSRDIDNTFFSGLILKDQIVNLINQGVQIGDFDHERLLEFIFKIFHFDLYFFETFITVEQYSFLDKLIQKEINNYDFIEQKIRLIKNYDPKQVTPYHSTLIEQYKNWILYLKVKENKYLDTTFPMGVSENFNELEEAKEKIQEQYSVISAKIEDQKELVDFIKFKRPTKNYTLLLKFMLLTFLICLFFLILSIFFKISIPF